MPHEAVSGLFFAVPLLGAAHALLKEWISATSGRTTTTGSARGTEHTLALATGQIAAAELLIQRAASTADNTHGPAGPLSRDLVVRCRLDYATAAKLLIEAVNRLFREAGARATSSGGPLPRLWRDANTAMHPALNLRPAAHAYAERVLTP